MKVRCWCSTLDRPFNDLMTTESCATVNQWQLLDQVFRHLGLHYFPLSTWLCLINLHCSLLGPGPNSVLSIWFNNGLLTKPLINFYRLTNEGILTGDILVRFRSIIAQDHKYIKKTKKTASEFIGPALPRVTDRCSYQLKGLLAHSIQFVSLPPFS